MQERSNRPPLRPVAATADRGSSYCVALFCLFSGVLALFLGGCGSAPPRRVHFKTPKSEASHTRYARALRLAARGRVQARAGLDGDASESLRLSYSIEPDLGVLTDHAEAAERAHYYGQAHAAWREVLRHQLTAAERKKATTQAERLATMVPADHMPVLITISPAHAKVTLERGLDGRRRTMLSDGVVWLKAGGWQAATLADGFKSELRAFRVDRRGNQSFAVVLAPGPKALRMADWRSSGKSGSRQPGGANLRRGKTHASADETLDDPNATKYGAAGSSGAESNGAESNGAGPEQTADAGDGSDDASAGDHFGGGVDTGIGSGQSVAGGGVSAWGPYVATVLGVAALGAGGYFGFNATQNVDIANGLAPSRPDYQTQLKFYGDAATSRAQLANTLFIAGGALAAVGSLWWLLAPRSNTVAAASPLRPSAMSITGRGFVALWTF